ncbi:MAG: ABC transporter permease [Candidatus Aquicultor sp.]
MNSFSNAAIVEFNKARRSKVSVITLLAFLIVPAMGAFFMIILKDPQRAKDLGLIGAKAQLTAGVANWDAYLGLLSQAVATGGLFILSFFAAWIFGREYINKTLKDLLALPTSRTTIVMAKFAIITLWSLFLVALIFAVGLLLGFVIDLPGWSTQLLLDMISRYLVVSLLTILLVWPVALAANLGKSYFPALGFLFFVFFLSQIAVIIGWGDYFPWAIPALVSNIGKIAGPGFASYLLVVITGLIGIFGTVAWWNYADHAS